MKKIILLLILLLAATVFADRKYSHAVLKSNPYTYVFELRDNNCVAEIFAVYDKDITKISIAHDMFISNIYFIDGYEMTINENGQATLYDADAGYVKKTEAGQVNIKQLYKCLTTK